MGWRGIPPPPSPAAESPAGASLTWALSSISEASGYQLQGGQPELLNLAGEPKGVQAPPRGRDLQVASPLGPHPWPFLSSQGPRSGAGLPRTLPPGPQALETEGQSGAPGSVLLRLEVASSLTSELLHSAL